MLLPRVIPCLDVDGGRVVKGVRFQGLRDAGDPVELELIEREGAFWRVGILAGPFVLNFVHEEHVQRFLLLDELSLAFIAFAAGAVLGWLLVRGLFDIGIIVTTALGGGWYVAVGLGSTDVELAAETSVWIGLGVALLGVAVQTGMWRRGVRAARRQAPSPTS